MLEAYNTKTRSYASQEEAYDVFFFYTRLGRTWILVVLFVVVITRKETKPLDAIPKHTYKRYSRDRCISNLPVFVLFPRECQQPCNETFKSYTSTDTPQGAENLR